jgi:predicted ATPase
LAAGLTRQELAERAGLSAVGIGALERGERQIPRFATVRLLADALALGPAERARLIAAVGVAQLGAGNDTASGEVDTESLPTNLPSLMTSFHGRADQLAPLCKLVDERRIVTVCGPGGIGKTRLAIETAHTIARAAAARFSDGVWFVDFAPVADPSLLVSQISMVIDVHEQPGAPPLDALLGALRDKHVLLVLDSCEHVIAAAAGLAHRLVTVCPNLHVLATSREPLRIPGERVKRLGPLRLPEDCDGRIPSMEELFASPAVQLFFDRSADSAPAFAVQDGDVASRLALLRLTQRLDGIPLAIELAATWMRSLPLPALAQRLEDRLQLLTRGSRAAAPRHQTLRATLDWSYSLLATREQQVFERLGIFEGGWTLGAAQEVCSDSAIGADDVADLTLSLVDKSLIVVDAPGRINKPRYRMLETMRTYALERLALRAGEHERVARRRAQHYRSVAAQIDANFVGPDAQDALDRDLANFRGALTWALAERGDLDSGIALAAAGRFVFLHWSLFREGAAWCERALEALGEQQGSVQEARLYRNLAIFWWYVFGPKRARTAAAHAATIYRKLGELPALSSTLAILAEAAYRSGERAEAYRHASEAVTIVRGVTVLRSVSGFALTIAALTTDSRDVSTRYTLIDEAITTLKPQHDASPDGSGYAYALSVAGEIAFESDDIKRARQYARRSISEAWSTTALAAMCWTRLGAYALADGDLVEAREAAREALALLPNAIAAARTPVLWLFAAVAALSGKHHSATHLLGAADAQAPALQRPRDSIEEALHGRTLSVLRSALGDDEISRLRAEGAAWTAERATAAALAD